MGDVVQDGIPLCAEVKPRTAARARTSEYCMLLLFVSRWIVFGSRTRVSESSVKNTKRKSRGNRNERSIKLDWAFVFALHGEPIGQRHNSSLGRSFRV